MHGASISGAIAALADQINAALLAGHDTRELRHELSALEQRQRREAAAALARDIENRVRERVAGLEAPAAPKVRRTPVGIHVAEENNE